MGPVCHFTDRLAQRPATQSACGAPDVRPPEQRSILRLAGDTFTLADCGGAVHLQLVASATKIIYGRGSRGRP